METQINQNSATKILVEIFFNNCPQQIKIHRWVRKFHTTASVNKIRKVVNPRSGRKLTARCPDNVYAVRYSVGRSPRKFFRRRSQELDLSRTLYDKVSQFLPLSPGLTFLKWYDWLLRLRWKMTWSNMNYHINGFHLFWDTIYIYIYIYIFVCVCVCVHLCFINLNLLISFERWSYHSVIFVKLTKQVAEFFLIMNLLDLVATFSFFYVSSE